MTLDGAPVSGVDPARFSVTLEFPLSLDEFNLAMRSTTRPEFFATGLLRTEMIVDGAIAVKDGTIAWSLPANVYYYLLNALESLDGFADQGQYVRTRVRLRGGMIWGAGTGAMLYLDGQCFGVSSTRADGRTPRTGLIMPSGAAAKASDFESWFDLAPLPRVTSLSVAPPAVAWVPGPGNALRLVDASNLTAAASPVLNLSLNYNAIADSQVAITVSGGTAGIVNGPEPRNDPARRDLASTSDSGFRRQPRGEDGGLHVHGERHFGERRCIYDRNHVERDRTCAPWP